ncbi:hypothetical protein Celaphus_00008846 [Cervus elaphus hippelaphus]|uniref:small monomeric GTPase n=1 Tax=Cervus elaphus hippelaphus TaxID=46360 RepID=A0A212DIX2_CEREH|nr:hypothetical protein Celaphus_00008846 [Cervus elaphus hippelaphus]
MTSANFNVGDYAQAQRVWKNYLPAINSVIFLEDCADHERLLESKEELNLLMTVETISNASILILGNEINRPEAIDEERL